MKAFVSVIFFPHTAALHVIDGCNVVMNDLLLAAAHARHTVGKSEAYGPRSYGSREVPAIYLQQQCASWSN